jgi:hypothetical protein
VRALTGYLRARRTGLPIEKTNSEDNTDALRGSERIIAFFSRPTNKSEKICGRRRYADF